MTQRDTGWPKEIQGDPKRYRVTQRAIVWLSEIQGDSVRHRVTQRYTWWLKGLQGDSMRFRVIQRDTGWLSEIQGDPKRYRVTHIAKGWLYEVQGDIIKQQIGVTLSVCVEKYMLPGMLPWHAIASKSFRLVRQRNLICFKIFQASQAEEFDLLWMTNGSGIGVQRFSWPDPRNSG